VESGKAERQKTALRVARVDELVQRARGNDNDSTRFDLAPFISDGDRDAALDRECDFDVRMPLAAGSSFSSENEVASLRRWLRLVSED
jgi:hypothetical protein